MPSKTLFKKYYESCTSRGFGLIELMVSISVMVLVTSIILARQDSFNGATLLRGQAYELALAVREMQLLAVSATKGTDSFRNVYGLYFNTTNPNKYNIFRDANDDYFTNGTENFGKQGVIDGRFQIDEIRLMDGSSNDEVQAIAISFERPNFDAKIYEGASNPVDDDVYGVEIDIRVKGSTGSGPGEVRTVEITRAGQITVKNI